MDIWSFIWTNFGPLGLSAILVFLSRTWISERLKKSIEHEYNEKLETFKAQQQQALEGYKAGYQHFLDENHIRFSWWHRKQAEAIKKLYDSVYDLECAADRMVRSGDYTLLSAEISPKEHREDAEKNFLGKNDNFRVCIQQNHIFIPDNCLEQINSFQETLFLIYEPYRNSKDLGSGFCIQAFKEHEKAEGIIAQLGEVRKNLRSEFISILRG